MKMRSTILLLGLLAAGTGTPALAQPPTGSQLSPDEDTCVTCHSEPDLWDDDTLHLYVPKELLAEDVHSLKGVNCHDCHGGDPSSFDVPVAHAVDIEAEEGGVAPFRAELSEVKKLCGHCHQQQRLGMLKGVHAKAGEKDGRGRGTVLDCGDCHGEKVHGMRPVENSQSPVFLDHQVRLCGGCHERDLETYGLTPHGKGLHGSEPEATAVCADCHGAHDMYYAADRRSTLHVSKVADTCGECHEAIKQQIARSVHSLDGLADAPDDLSKRRPSCTNCHQGHDLINPDVSAFRLEVQSLCGNCHADLSATYAMSMHGELSERGYAPAAQCADCHGPHEILAIGDPASRLAPGESRLQTCRECHRNANLKFTEFEPHADYRNATKNPKLYFVYHDVSVALFWVFTLFLAHAVLWILRSLVYTLRHGRHKLLATQQNTLIHFNPIHCAFYWYLIVAFPGLTLSGLLLQYGSYGWAQWLASYLGGIQNIAVWHNNLAVVALCTGGVHVAWVVLLGVKRIRRKQKLRTVLFGPDSPAPNRRDLRDLADMLVWFIGMGRRHRFERWTYWEKFDYWAVWGLAIVLGTSGLMLWCPNLFCSVLSGASLNMAKVVHSRLAIPLTSVIFAIHCIHTHFRPEKFPINLSVLTGCVSEEHLRKYRPEYYERLRRSGKLLRMRRSGPSPKGLRFLAIAGGFVFSLGLCVLMLVVFARLGK